MKPIYYYHLPAGFAALITLVIAIVPGPKLPHLPELGIDKFFHLAEFAIAGFLFYRSLFHSLLKNNAIVLGITGTFLWSVATEIIQIPIPGRYCDIIDIVANLTGILLVFSIIIVRKIWIEREKNIDK